MKRLLLLTLAVVALVAACQPTKTPPPSDAEREIAKCGAAFNEVAGLRPDAIIVFNQCRDFGDDFSPGFYYPPPRNFVEENTHSARTEHNYAEGFAHENGIAWRFNRLTPEQRDQTIALSGRDPAPFSETTREAFYAEVWRYLVFADAFGGLVVTPEQGAAICAEMLVPC